MMRNKFVVAAVVACCGLSFAPSQVALAHEGHGDPNIVVPETADGVLQEIKKHHAAIAAAVNGKNLKAVHDQAEAIIALARALPPKVDADRKMDVERTAKNVRELADSVHHAADAGNQPRSGIELKKLDGAVMTLEKQVKPE